MLALTTSTEAARGVSSGACGTTQASHFSGFCSWIGELVLHLAQRGEVLVELDLVGLADVGQQRLALIGDGRQHALTQHDRWIGFPVGAVRILEALAEQARVERERRGLRRGEACCPVRVE